MFRDCIERDDGSVFDTDVPWGGVAQEDVVLNAVVGVFGDLDDTDFTEALDDFPLRGIVRAEKSLADGEPGKLFAFQEIWWQQAFKSRDRRGDPIEDGPAVQVVARVGVSRGDDVVVHSVGIDLEHLEPEAEVVAVCPFQDAIPGIGYRQGNEMLISTLEVDLAFNGSR